MRPALATSVLRTFLHPPFALAISCHRRSSRVIVGHAMARQLFWRLFSRRFPLLQISRIARPLFLAQEFMAAVRLTTTVLISNYVCGMVTRKLLWSRSFIPKSRRGPPRVHCQTSSADSRFTLPPNTSIAAGACCRFAANAPLWRAGESIRRGARVLTNYERGSPATTRTWA